jgi:hypothetical protein
VNFPPLQPTSHQTPPSNPQPNQLPPPTNRQPQQGLIAPVALSVSLFGLYLILKYTDFNLQTFLSAYFWLLATLALSGAGAPLLKRAGDAFGQPTWDLEVPEGLLLDEDGEFVRRADLQPSAVAAVGVAVGVATWQAMHPMGFTLNNLVREVLCGSLA